MIDYTLSLKVCCYCIFVLLSRILVARHNRMAEKLWRQTLRDYQAPAIVTGPVDLSNPSCPPYLYKLVSICMFQSVRNIECMPWYPPRGVRPGVPVPPTGYMYPLRVIHPVPKSLSGQLGT